jgi:peptidoglycan/LPS O-acetylase OafA/YrhL
MTMRSNIQLFHILVVSTLFMYVGIKRDQTPKWLFNLLLVLGILLISFHLYRAYIKYSNGTYPWVNIIHFFYVGPILIYIGYKQDKTERHYFEILLILAFGALGYHSYNNLINSDSDKIE